MAIAKSNHYWVSRLAGNNPASPTGKNNTAWTLTSGYGGSASGNAWRIKDQQWKYSPTNTKMNVLCAIAYKAAPNTNVVLMALYTGTHHIRVQCKTYDNQPQWMMYI